MSMPFQVVFSDSSQQEIQYDNWGQGDGNQYPVWNCKVPDAPVVVSVRDQFNGSYIIKIMNIGQTGVAGWWGIRQKWSLFFLLAPEVDCQEQGNRILLTNCGVTAEFAAQIPFCLRPSQCVRNFAIVPTNCIVLDGSGDTTVQTVFSVKSL